MPLKVSILIKTFIIETFMKFDFSISPRTGWRRKKKLKQHERNWIKKSENFKTFFFFKHCECTNQNFFLLWNLKLFFVSLVPFFSVSEGRNKVF